MRSKTKLRTLAGVLTLAALAMTAVPAQAAGRATTPGVLADARAWMVGVLSKWLGLNALSGEAGHGIDPDGGRVPGGAGNEAGHGIDPNGGRATTAGADNEHGHGIDPDG